MDNYILKQSRELRAAGCERFPAPNADVDLFPCVPLGEVVMGMLSGGDPVKPVSGEALYDEDDSPDIDVGSTFGNDRFDCMEESRRLAASKFTELRNQRKADAEAKRQAEIDAAIAASKANSAE